MRPVVYVIKYVFVLVTLHLLHVTCKHFPDAFFIVCMYVPQRNLAKRDGGWTGSSLLPLIILAEKSGGNSYLVVGVSPLQSAASAGGVAITEEQQMRLLPLTNFRQFFKQAAKEINATYRSNCK
jgi:hypothetical protein